MNVNKVLDAKGLACPMPIVKKKSNERIRKWSSFGNTCYG